MKTNKFSKDPILSIDEMRGQTIGDSGTDSEKCYVEHSCPEGSEKPSVACSGATGTCEFVEKDGKNGVKCGDNVEAYCSKKSESGGSGSGDSGSGGSGDSGDSGSGGSGNLPPKVEACVGLSNGASCSYEYNGHKYYGRCRPDPNYGTNRLYCSDLNK